MKKLTLVALFIAGLSVSAQAQFGGVIIAGASVVVYNQPVVYNAPVEYNAPVIYNAPVVYNPPPVATCQPAVCNTSYATPDCQKVVYCGSSDTCTVWVPNVSVTYFGGHQARQQGYNFGWRR